MKIDKSIEKVTYDQFNEWFSDGLGDENLVNKAKSTEYKSLSIMTFEKFVELRDWYSFAETDEELMRVFHWVNCFRLEMPYKLIVSCIASYVWDNLEKMKMELHDHFPDLPRTNGL